MNRQSDLFEHFPHFDGDTYEPERDHTRLAGQLCRVFKLMRDAKWRTLGEICHDCGGTEAAISARLRDMRKDKFGAHIVNRRYLRRGLFTYQLIENPSVTVKVE